MIQADKIRKWARDRNLHDSDKSKQLLKLGEEFGETVEAFNKGQEDEFKDGLGDMFVVMTISALQHGIDIEECIDLAYNEVSDRKGILKNGVFVKEADLNGSQK